jgi:hypothetical protein
MNDPSLADFELRLTAIKPRRPQIDRDRLMFLAGQSSVVYYSPQTSSPNGSRSFLTSVMTSAITALVVMTLFQPVSTRIRQFAASPWSLQVVTLSASESKPMRAKPSGSDLVEYRIELGNSLGSIASWLGVVEQPDQKPAEPASLGQLRSELLSEQTGVVRADAAESSRRSSRKDDGWAPANPSLHDQEM